MTFRPALLVPLLLAAPALAQEAAPAPQEPAPQEPAPQEIESAFTWSGVDAAPTLPMGEGQEAYIA